MLLGAPYYHLKAAGIAALCFYCAFSVLHFATSSESRSKCQFVVYLGTAHVRSKVAEHKAGLATGKLTRAKVYAPKYYVRMYYYLSFVAISAKASKALRSKTVCLAQLVQLPKLARCVQRMYWLPEIV